MLPYGCPLLVHNCLICKTSAFSQFQDICTPVPSRLAIRRCFKHEASERQRCSLHSNSRRRQRRRHRRHRHYRCRRLLPRVNELRHSNDDGTTQYHTHASSLAFQTHVGAQTGPINNRRFRNSSPPNYCVRPTSTPDTHIRAHSREAFNRIHGQIFVRPYSALLCKPRKYGVEKAGKKKKISKK